MIDKKDYYTAPSQEIFDDIKKAAIEIWRTYDDSYGYATEKISRIKDLENISDNYAFIVAMFDWINQGKLIASVERQETKDLLIKLIGYPIC